jgi:hypothetical protein
VFTLLDGGRVQNRSEINSDSRTAWHRRGLCAKVLYTKKVTSQTSPPRITPASAT